MSKPKPRQKRIERKKPPSPRKEEVIRVILETIEKRKRDKTIPTINITSRKS